MKISLLFIAIVFISCAGTSLTSKYKGEISKYGLSNIDTIVDLGSGDGDFDKLIHKLFPKTFFILEDIEPQYKKSKNSWSETVIGTQDSIPLLSSKYKFVLCRNTVHEFKNHKNMLGEIKRILSSDGILIVVEVMPKFKGEISAICKNRLLMKEEIIELFTHNGFQFQSSEITSYELKHKGDRNFNILKFTN